jgi:hypothetical protein
MVEALDWMAMAAIGATSPLAAVATKDRNPPRPCENDFAGHRVARLIHGAHHPRIEALPRRPLRFFYCAPFATLDVFTQPAPRADLYSDSNEGPLWGHYSSFMSGRSSAVLSAR